VPSKVVGTAKTLLTASIDGCCDTGNGLDLALSAKTHHRQAIFDLYWFQLDGIGLIPVKSCANVVDQFLILEFTSCIENQGWLVFDSTNWIAADDIFF